MNPAKLTMVRVSAIPTSPIQPFIVAANSTVQLLRFQVTADFLLLGGPTTPD